MQCSQQHGSSIVARLASLAELFLLLATAIAAQAQTFTVLHTFTGQGDGSNPFAGLTRDRVGNLYGTTSGTISGAGNGTVFRLSHAGSGWVLNTLYAFHGSDGAAPQARVVFGPDGSLYGTTYTGGLGYGVVFNLRPSARACRTFICPWTETVLYSFTGGSDGDYPVGKLVFDSERNLYGVTWFGGNLSGCGGLGCGVAYKLAPSDSGWSETVIHTFGPDSGQDGAEPSGGLIFDPAGNLYC